MPRRVRFRRGRFPAARFWFARSPSVQFAAIQFPAAQLLTTRILAALLLVADAVEHVILVINVRSGLAIRGIPGVVWAPGAWPSGSRRSAASAASRPAPELSMAGQPRE